MRTGRENRKDAAPQRLRELFGMKVTTEVARMQPNLGGDFVAATSGSRELGSDHRGILRIKRHGPLRID